MFREARLDDFAHIVRLYRQLQPDDPALKDGSDAEVFRQILESPADWASSSWPAPCGPHRTRAATRRC
ncbi:hypothetical protein [Nonomuraea sp. NPDC049607]|uniref:hypothetical protein n=1 Tax=Nonomuraea sp. NPDC049607 TaxID=3154732 RepID=UPI00342884AE